MNHQTGTLQTEPPHAAPARFAARAVNRAIGELRRGIPVLLHASDTLVLLPVETATDHTLAEFSLHAKDAPVMLLAPGRARALLGEAPLATDAAVALRVPPVATMQALRAFADPVLASPSSAGVVEISNLFPPDLAQAALALAKLGRLLPAILAARARALPAGLLSTEAADVLRYPAITAAGLVRAAEARVPLAEAPDTRIVAFRPPDGGIEHLAIVIGRPEDAAAPLARVHSECFTGDLLGSLRCDCGAQLHQAIRLMEQEGAGVVLYMAQEGRGIGLVNKLRAYMLQDAGLDTLDANKALGFGADERSFAAASVMLKALGIARVRLLTNNPDKVAALAAAGIDVAGRVSHTIAANGVNDFYLDTKARRFGHLLG